MNVFKYNRFFFLIPVLVIFGSATVNAQVSDSLKIIDFNTNAVFKVNQSDYEGAAILCDSALKLGQNATSYYILSHIFNKQNKWKEAIENGEKSVQLNPNSMEAWQVLFMSYFGAHRWKDAINIGDKAIRGDPSGYTAGKLSEAKENLENEKVTKTILWILLVLFTGLLITPLFRKTVKNFRYLSENDYPRFRIIVLVASSVCCAFYFLFYSLSQWIWSLNPHLSAFEFTPFVGSFIYERDGVEGFVLFTMLLLVIALSFLITRCIIKLNLNQSQIIWLALFLIAVSAFYFYRIGFFPPMPDFHSEDGVIYPVYIFLPVFSGILLYSFYNHYTRSVQIVLFLFIAFATLITINPTSRTDLSYVLAPASRLKYGFKLSEIYFQYDFLLSLLALIWLKLNLLLDWFPYLGQVSFFLFFAGCLVFANNFFKNKSLSVLLVLALLLIRYYGVWEQGYSVFQVAPLRLDLWLLLVFIVYYKGGYHWLTGICLGLLIILHRNLGLLYLTSYGLFILFLFAKELIPQLSSGSKKNKQILNTLRNHIRLNAMNLLIVAASIIICFLLTGELFPRSALAYRKYGIGMLPVAENSFYWYIPVLFSSLAVLLFYHRKKLTDKYFNTAIFIILLAIANLMYFFGRSHENNLLNISGILILVLFILFDVLIFINPVPAKEKIQPKNKKKIQKKIMPVKRWVCISLPFIFVFLSSFIYSRRLNDKVSIQLENLNKNQLISPLMPDTIATTSIRQLTHQSKNAFFLDFRFDFYYYYYGQYEPQGYYNPVSSWIFRKDLRSFLQDLLDRQYYIVMDAGNFNEFSNYIPYLDYNAWEEKDNYIAIRKEKLPYLLNTDSASVFHRVLKDTLAAKGFEFAGIPLQEAFTIELVIKPTGDQPPGASILNNLTNYGLPRGFTIQLNNAQTDQYVFAYSNGTLNMSSMYFTLAKDQWHYLTVCVNKDRVRVYDYGNLLTTFEAAGKPYLNSEVPLVIGNNAGRYAPFKGHIREVKISKGNIAEQKIAKKGTEIKNLLNLNPERGQ